MAKILRQGGHLHEMPQALTVKDIKHHAATYNRSHDDLNHPIDSISMTVGLMSCTLSSFLLPKAPPKANWMIESLRCSIILLLNPPSYLALPPTLVVQLGTANTMRQVR